MSHIEGGTESDYYSQEEEDKNPGIVDQLYKQKNEDIDMEDA